MQGQDATDRQIIKISGADAETFLQGLVTNDINGLQNGLVYAALLTPQGKYIADFFLVPSDQAILLDVKSDIAGPLAQRLSMYKLRANVEIAPIDCPVVIGTGTPPQGSLTDPRHPSLGWRSYGQAAHSKTQVDWTDLRVNACVPETGIELTPDTYILEAGFERLNGVDFRKGCYVGQEVTARMKHKTQLRKGLTKLEISGHAPLGTEIVANGKTCGTLFSQSNGHAIAHLRFERATAEMTAADATIRWSGETEG